MNLKSGIKNVFHFADTKPLKHLLMLNNQKTPLQVFFLYGTQILSIKIWSLCAISSLLIFLTSSIKFNN